MSSAARDLETCQKMCEELRGQIQQIRQQTGKKILAELSTDVEVVEYEPKQRNLCTGHFGKIYALHWGPDSQAIVTASQDGKLIIWNSKSGNKQLAITLNSAWVMTCAFSPTYEYIASGGLDNTVSIFKTSNQNAQAGTYPLSIIHLYLILYHYIRAYSQHAKSQYHKINIKYK